MVDREYLNAKKKSLKTTQLIGPTYFAQILKTTIEVMKKEVKSSMNEYYVFLILTDGKIDDME